MLGVKEQQEPPPVPTGLDTPVRVSYLYDPSFLPPECTYLLNFHQLAWWIGLLEIEDFRDLDFDQRTAKSHLALNRLVAAGAHCTDLEPPQSQWIDIQRVLNEQLIAFLRP